MTFLQPAGLALLIASSCVGAFLFFLMVQSRFICNLPDSVPKAVAEIGLHLAAFSAPLYILFVFATRKKMVTPFADRTLSMLWNVSILIFVTTFLAFTVSEWYRRKRLSASVPGTVLRYRPVPYAVGGANSLRVPFPRINCVFDLNCVDLVVTVSGLPEVWKGLKIGHLTDFHVGGICHADYVRYAVDRVLEEKPDLIAITGDFVNFKRYLDTCFEVFNGLDAPLGVFVVRGNHDYWVAPDEIAARIQALGYTLLNDRTVRVRRDGETLLVSGIESPWSCSGIPLDFIPDNTRFLKIVLSHSPDEFPRLVRRSPHLVLSGHTHGGQICFPFYGPVLVPSGYGRKYAAGVFREKESFLFVSRGIGCYPPLRTLCKPEIAVIRFD